MFKGDITLCGSISRTAELKKNKDGGEFIVFSVKYPAVGRDKSVSDIVIMVSANGGKQETSVYTTGRKVSVKGTLTIRKKDDKVFYNLRAESEPALVNPTEEDSLEGTVHFEGKTSKKPIRTGCDKNGQEYLGFSAWSKDKERNSENPAFVWFNFMYFHPTDEHKALIKPDTYLAIDGDFQLRSYNGKPDNNITVHDVKPVEFDHKKE